MAKISKDDVYQFDKPVSGKDYLIGTDGDIGQGKRTKNFKLEDIANFINEFNGNSSMSFIFSDGSNPSINFLSDGYFFSKLNQTDPPLISKLQFNNKNIEGTDISYLFSILVQSGLLVLKLNNIADKTNVIYLTLGTFIQNAGYFDFTASLYNNIASGVLINDSVYSVSFEIANTEVLETKLTALGTTTKNVNQIELSIGFEWKINGFDYANTSLFSSIIPLASSGYKRIDIIVANTSDTFQVITGEESNSVAIEPLTPSNTVKVCAINVFDDDFSQIPALFTDVVRQKGFHNPVTNTPILSDLTGQTGDEWIITANGTRNYGSGPITLKINDVLAKDNAKWFKKVNNNQNNNKRSFFCSWKINQNFSASTLWYYLPQAVSLRGNFSTGASLTPSNNFSACLVQTPFFSIPFNSKIKSVNVAGWTNSGSVAMRLCLVSSEISLTNGVNTIQNSVIIADNTFNTHSPQVSGFRYLFSSGLSSSGINSGNEIRLFLFNNNLTSNLFDTIITVEFEENI